MKFDSLEHLTLEFSDYVNGYNKLRIHGTLGYVSPIDYKQSSLKKAVWFNVDNPKNVLVPIKLGKKDKVKSSYYNSKISQSKALNS